MEHGSIPIRSQSPTVPDHILRDTHNAELTYEDAVAIERSIIETKRERLEIQRQRLLLKLEKLDAVRDELDAKYERLSGRPKSVRADRSSVNVRRFHLETQRKIAAKDRESLYIEREAVRLERDMKSDMRSVMGDESRRTTRYYESPADIGMPPPIPSTFEQMGNSIHRPRTAPPGPEPNPLGSSPSQRRPQRTSSAKTTPTMISTTSTHEKLSKVQKLRLIMGWLGSRFPEVPNEEVMSAAERAPTLMATVMAMGGTDDFPFRSEAEILSFVKAEMQSVAGNDFAARDYRKKFCESYGDLAVLAYGTIAVLHGR